VMTEYKQLTYEQRCHIEAYMKTDFSQRQIARLVGVHQSTISRELRRNLGLRGYRCDQVQRLSTDRRRDAVRAHVMTPAMIANIEYLLAKRWSPEQISSWLRLALGEFVSHERIYQHVWADKKRGGTLYQFLRRHGKKYQSRGKRLAGRGYIKNAVSIDERPAHVENRDEVGHWEIDTVIGKDHSGALVTIVERATRFTVCMRVMKKTAEEIARATNTLLKPLKGLVRSITADNGKEFAYHEQIAKALDCKFYFAHPYASLCILGAWEHGSMGAWEHGSMGAWEHGSMGAWEHGLNENTNGVLRQYYPKNTDFIAIDDGELKRNLLELNERPRKVLGFIAPVDLMKKELAALAA
jgi:transposase, IS30 family